jgi:hypothetical protein
MEENPRSQSPKGRRWEAALGEKSLAASPPALGQKQERCGFDEFQEVAFFLMKKAVKDSGLAISILFLR